MTSSRIVNNANKFTYLAKAYPEKTVAELVKLLQLLAIDMNCAIWLALELKWVSVVDRPTYDPKTEQDIVLQYIEVINQPKTWDFGADEQELESALEYMFEKLNADEKDVEENYLNNIVAGYPPRDIIIAVKRLIEDGVLHEYQIEDSENNYIFYTLKKNAGKNWGAKQFKTNPLTSESDETETAATTTETTTAEQ